MQFLRIEGQLHYMQDTISIHSTVGDRQLAYQAPTGILTGPLDDIRSKLTQPAVVLMNL